jgi:hypothetical protein
VKGEPIDAAVKCRSTSSHLCRAPITSLIADRRSQRTRGESSPFVPAEEPPRRKFSGAQGRVWTSHAWAGAYAQGGVFLVDGAEEVLQLALARASRSRSRPLASRRPLRADFSSKTPKLGAYLTRQVIRSAEIESGAHKPGCGQEGLAMCV